MNMDPGALLARLPENDASDPWYGRNIPLFECSDEAVTDLYYYRCWLMRRHLAYHADIDCHLFSEFSTREPLYWAGARNYIVCASDHHVNEARWLRDRRYAREHVSFFLRDPGAQPQNYSSALAASVLSILEVEDDAAFATGLLDGLIENHDRWKRGLSDYPHDSGFDPEFGMFWNTGRDSSGEYNLASAQLSEPLRGIQGYKIRGGAGYRPDINADMFADMRAIALIARRAGRLDVAERFAADAATLRDTVSASLWDGERQFFLHRWRRDEYADGDRWGAPSIKAGSLIWQTNLRRCGIGHQPGADGTRKGRELIGYVPWYRGLAPDTDAFAQAWRHIEDPEIFGASYGPATAERGDPWFSIQFDCRANGNAFPLVTSRVLNGAANLLNDHVHHGPMDAAGYRRLFMSYVRTQAKDGRPYLAEFHHPDEDLWVVDRPIGQHYFHSSFLDLLITGMIGVRPGKGPDLVLNPLVEEAWSHFAISGLCYRGHDIAVAYDADGSRHGAAGFAIVVDGVERHRSATPRPVVIAL